MPGAVPPEEKPLQRSVFRDWVESNERNQTITALEVCEKHGCPRYLVTSRIEMQIEQAAACQALPFTLLLVMSYACVAIAHMDAASVRAVEFSVSFDVEDNANFASDSDFAAHKDIYDVNSYADFWSFMSNGLIPLLFIHERPYSEDLIYRNGSVEPNIAPWQPLDQKQWGMMIYYNRIVGGIRFRQERAKEVKCDKNPELNKFYNRTCLGDPRDYSLDPEVEKARGMEADEKWTRWIWVHEPADQVQQKIKKLELEGWLDTLTEKIEISIPIYNAEYSIHSLMNVNFYFSRGGHIWKHIITQSCYANWFSSWYQWLFDGIYFGCMMWIFLNELADVAKTWSEYGFRGIWNNYIGVWNVLDWMSIVCGFLLMVFFFWCLEYTKALNEAGIEFGKMQRPIPHSTPNIPSVQKYIDELEVAVNWVTFTQKSLARYPLIIVFRLFKSFHAQPRLALVTKTLQSSMEDLFHFLIVFFCVMLGFITSAVVLFGREVEDLSTFFRGSIYCTRLILGDMDFDSLKVAGRLLAGLWMCGFMVFASLLLLNMLLAIVMDSYSDVKSGSVSSQTLWGQLAQSLRNMDGMHVPMKIILKAMEDAMPQDLKDKIAAKKEAEKKKKKKKKRRKSDDEDEEKSEDSEDDDDDDLDDERAEFDRMPINMEELIGIVAAPKPVKEDSVAALVFGTKKKKQWNMTTSQAKEIILGAIMEYYDENQESADNFEFINMAETIHQRVHSIANTHKRFNNREQDAVPKDPADDDDDDDDDDRSAADDDDSATEEKKDEAEDYDHEDDDMDKPVNPDVREVMRQVKKEFDNFLHDVNSDRALALSEIARLNLEVEALRDRLTESSQLPGSLGDVWDSFVTTSGPGDAALRSALTTTANPSDVRLTPLLEGDDEDKEQTIVDGLQRPSPMAEITDQPSRAVPSGMALPAQPAMVDRQVTAEKLAALQGKAPRGQSGESYVSVMKRQGLLPSDFKVPSDQASADWPEDISMPNTPPGSQSGRYDRRLEGRGSDASSVSSFRGRHGGMDTGLSDYSDFDESEYLDDFSNAGDNRSLMSDDEMGDAPIGVPFRVHNTRVVDGVGLTSTRGAAQEPQPTPQDFEFTNFKDAQSQLRHMLNKHRPMVAEEMSSTRSAI